MSRTGIRCAPLFASLALLACGEPALVGEECVDSADCDEGLSCFEHEGAEVSPVCMADCDLSATRRCDEGQVCTRATGTDRPEDLGVCYLGGTTAVGEACTGNLECEAGAICVDTGDVQACFVACDTEDGAACAEGETCAPLEDMGTNGFCQSGA
ncbi:MAG TPA: hypothetical protein RMH99_06845 [Sandaracinaceae bacterium LLY-WYZ-13_1]|nr:hypothetical protein [Sandaracinaceae bacterium LLY-WYZ-13_1]